MLTCTNVESKVKKFIIHEEYETLKNEEEEKKPKCSTFCSQTPNVLKVIWFYHQFYNLTAVSRIFYPKVKTHFKTCLLNSAQRLFLVSLAIPIISKPLGCYSV